MIGWTIAAAITLAFLLGLTWLGKQVTDSWAKAALVVLAAVVVAFILAAAIYGADSLVKAGI